MEGLLGSYGELLVNYLGSDFENTCELFRICWGVIGELLGSYWGVVGNYSGVNGGLF